MYYKSTHIAFILFLWALPQFLCAQTVEWSNQQKLKTKTNYTRIFGENASGYYLMRSKNADLGSEIIIEKYKSNLALELTIELDQPQHSFIEKVIVQNDGLLIFATHRNDSLPKVDVLYWKLNNQLQRTQPIKAFVQIDAALFKNNSAIFIQPSVNKSAFCLFYTTDGIEKNKSVLNLIGFDAGANITFSKTITVSTLAENIENPLLECDNAGNTYLLVNYPPTSDRKHKNTKNYFLYAYNKQIDKILEYEIKQDSTYISDIALVINNDAKLITVAGFYNTENNGKVLGSFMYSINTESNLLQVKNYEPFKQAFVTKVITTLLNEETNQLASLKVRKLLARSDGGITIVAEKAYETRQTYTYYANGFPQTASRVTYNFDEIIVLSQTAAGKNEFSDFIKKTQSSMNDGGYYSSFVMLNTNDKLSFIYNTTANDEGDIMISSINPIGQIDTRILIKSLSYYVQLMPPESKQINNSSTLICTLKDRRFTLMKLTY
jgi:hypothetical protein